MDDGSTDDTCIAFSSVQRELSNFPIKNVTVEVITHTSRMGFSQTLSSGLKEILRICPTCDLVIVFPGNDQVEQSSISSLFDYSLPNTVCLGYRTNKRQERPFLKWICSTVLQGMSKLLVFPNLKDLTGQFMVPPQLLVKAVEDNPGHAWSVRLSRLILLSQLPVIQIPICLKKGFKRRPWSQGFRQYPRLKDMAQYSLSLLSEFIYLTKTRKLATIKRLPIKTVETAVAYDVFE